ncbi:MAG: hypothetical protein AAF363_14370 [Bacteroidota bacterium]
MHKFSDFKIAPEINSFTGDKISIKKILNLNIVVLGFKIGPSKQKEGTEYLTLHIEKSNEERVVFTGSNVLIDQIKRVPEQHFPFETTIKGDNNYYEFT